MNKQEFQKTIRNMEPPKHFSALGFKEAFNEGFNSAKNNALFNSCFLNEPEKPVLPQFIADWLEVCKENLGFSLSSAMSHSTSAMKAQSNKVQGWFNLKNNQETFAKAWLFGYEVEKEKLYTVEIPNPNGGTYLALCKDVDGKLFFDVFFSEEWKTFGKCKLTESEIKKDFEWAWQFAKEVEE
ncbi:DUF1642 domain-containing protein [Streptococcus lutetiensis]|uniref:DUF1642 domain-containing protein n=1 Tax=Streptococcus lutetiensis TaxID=150055 RepID=UPI001BDB3720|nr:DUF1642 domain-containing protein [Streptococcus lutetiensis]MBT0910860.1 DUF1642 domain-containing protein [Streptococcus lutetiensis]